MAAKWNRILKESLAEKFVHGIVTTNIFPN
jgi:hypothetical protein